MSLIILTFLLLQLLAPATWAINLPTATVTCQPGGVSPIIKLSEDAVDKAAGKRTAIKIVIGNGGSNCESDYKDVPVDGEATVTRTDIAGSDIPVAFGCGSTPSTDDASKITNTVRMGVVIGLIKNNMLRPIKYMFNLVCELNRNTQGTVGQIYTVSDKLEVEEPPVVAETFSLTTTMDFFISPAYEQVQVGDFVIDNSGLLYIAISEALTEEASNKALKFTVQECIASINADSTNRDVVDAFVADECVSDNSIAFQRMGGDDMWAYRWQMRAFYFYGHEDKPIFIHCEMFVCEKDDDGAAQGGKCVQSTKAECDIARGKRRKRRNTEENRRKIISSHQKFTVQSSQMYGPVCMPNFVYNRLTTKCTNKQLLLIKGIYLDLEWNPQYANTSSPFYLNFVRSTEFLLYSMVQQTIKENVISGIRIVGVRPGSVVLDVLVTHEPASTSEETFTIFEWVILKGSKTAVRINNFLNIRSDKSIEYVPIIIEESTGIDSKTILIVVIVVAFALVVALGLGIFYKLMSRRRSSSTPTNGIIGVDNKALERK